jgi:iron complex outermembrane receptor protein
MKRSIFLIILLGACLLYSAEPDSLRGRRYYHLQGIRIVAESPKESVGSITLKPLSKDAPASESNLSEAVKDVPGVSISTGAKNESNLRIRAFQKEDVKIMIDGRSINGGYFGNVSLNDIPLFDIDEVQIVKGPVSSLYGFNSMGGTVNYVSKKANKDDWLKFSTIYKRNNTGSTKLSLSHEFTDWNFWFNVSRNNSDGFILSKDFKPTTYENGDVRNMADYCNYDFQFKTDFKIFEYSSIGFAGGYTFADEKKMPSSVYESLFRKFSDWERSNFSIISSLMHGENFESKHRIYYDYYSNTLQEFTDYEMNNMSLNSELNSYSLGYEGNLSYNSFNKLKSNLIYKTEKQYYNRQDNQSYQTKVDNATYTNQISQFNIYSLNKDMDLSFGAGLASSIRDYNNKKYYSPLYTEMCAGLNIKNFYSRTLLFGISRNIQYPTMHELFSSSKGNVNLHAEKALKAEISIAHSLKILKGADLHNTIFFNSVNDIIEVKDGKYTNIRNLKNCGFESAASLSFTKWSTGELSYTYMKLDMNNDYPYYEIPKHQINTSLAVILPYQIKVKYKFDYYGERISQDDEGGEHELGAYSLHGMQLSKSFNKDLRLLAGVDNIFDQNYFEEYGFPASGLNFYFGFESVLF